MAHPSITAAITGSFQVVLGAIAMVVVVIIMQGFWGIMPGTRVCGLRTLRSTLRPCGIARSFLREIVLAIDSCYLLCWVPGILSIVLTQCRQGLGDRIADTIVVDARSLKRSATNRERLS